MKLPLSLWLLSFCLLSGPAQVYAEKPYFGLSIADISAEVANGSNENLGTISGTLGVQLLDFIGVELVIGRASDRTGSIWKDPLISYQAVMLRLSYRWNSVGVYVLGGQARLDIDEQLNIGDDGNAFGFGLNLYGNNTTSLNLRVLNIDDGSVGVASIGFQYFFGGFAK